MGGIGGMMTATGSLPPDALLQALAGALAHRGPEGNSIHRFQDVGLVQTRRDIEDGSDGMAGGRALVADAVILNDEPPLALYRRQGVDFAQQLRGAYAIALHDAAAGRLLLARDPFGSKPLYYLVTPGGVAFASEPQALLRTGLTPPLLMRQTRNELLQLQFTTGRDTIFSGIERVLPGETVVVARGRIVERRRRAALPAGGAVEQGRPTAVADFERVFADSVRLHRRDEVPSGLFLAGDIASIALLAMLAQDGGPVSAFTATFSRGGPGGDGLAAVAAASAFGARHVEVLFREADLWRLLPEIAATVDDPAAPYEVLTSYKLAAAAQEAGLRAVITGAGGNALFAGHRRYHRVMRPWWAGGEPLHARGALEGLGLLRGDLAGWRDGIAAAELDAARPGRTRLQIAQAADCTEWLSNDRLSSLDRCLAAFAIDGRAPFLDSAVADVAFRLPDELKVRRGGGAWLLRCWLAERHPALTPFARHLPATVPVGYWLERRGAQLGPLVAAQPCVREICLPDRVERLFREAARGRRSTAAWMLLFYALWHRHHIQGLRPEVDVFATLATAG